MRALVVGDERDAVMNLGILLRSEGVEVELESFLHMHRTVARFQPDAVLLALAASDRVNVAQELRELYAERCPVLIDVARPYDATALLKQVLAIRPARR